MITDATNAALEKRSQNVKAEVAAVGKPYRGVSPFALMGSVNTTAKNHYDVRATQVDGHTINHPEGSASDYYK